MKLKIEITDTFAGEANYAWVRRYEAESKKDTVRSRVIAAKAAAGWTGTPCYVMQLSDSNDTLVIRPRDGSCIVMFVECVD